MTVVAGSEQVTVDGVRMTRGEAADFERDLGDEAHRFLVRDQLAEVGLKARILLEPAGRSTAAAVAVAALACATDDPVLLVLASDHASYITGSTINASGGFLMY